VKVWELEGHKVTRKTEAGKYEVYNVEVPGLESGKAIAQKSGGWNVRRALQGNSGCELC
jgi:hypothetical protein